MKQNYKITFSGTILFGFEREKVQVDIQQLLKLNATQVAHLFSGKQVVLKKNLPLDEAQRLKSLLENKGLLVGMEEDKAELSVEATLTAPVHSTSHTNDSNPSSTDTVSSYYAPPSASLSSQGESNKGFSTDANAPGFFKLSFKGRYGRLNYLNLSWAIYGIVLLVAFVFGFIFVSTGVNPNTMDDSSPAMIILYLTILPFVLYVSIRGAALRLHDLNKSAWYCLVLLAGIIPVIGGLVTLAFTLYLLFARGTDGDNDYGVQPKQGNIVGLVLTCITIVIVIIAIIFVIPSFRYF